MKNLARHIYRRIRAQLLQRMIPKSQAQLPNSLDDLHIEILGFFCSISGIGESARLCAQQLADDGYLVTCTSVEKYFRKPEEIAWHWDNPTLTEKHHPKVNCRIFHLNPPMLPPVILQMGLDNFKNTYNIGYWAWELETIPAEWVNALAYMNAIFTPSHFTTEVIQRYTKSPVITATHPVTPGQSTSDIRSRLNIPEEAFLVSSIFSFGSALERKNPQGIVNAFKQAFHGTTEAYLVLKSNAGGDTTEKQQLLESIRAYPNILLIDQAWSRADVLGLIETSTLYASLHRSEGFGLTIAEALLLGTPVLVTAWSGNMDFCSDENSFLVPYDPIQVNSSHPEFREFENATWADADTDYAAKILSKVYYNPQLVAEKRFHCTQQIKTCIAQNKYQIALRKLINSQSHNL